MLDYYKGNLGLLEKLAVAYGFKYQIFFQPIGLLYKNHRFVKNQSEFDSAFFAVKQVSYLQKELSKQIKAGSFAHYTDLSDLEKNCPEPYVDLTHYSAAFNRVMAKTILSTTQTHLE
jgi:hypothetical protein